MVARDWLAQVVQPAYWPARLTRTPADPHRFAACRATETCWGIERYDLPVSGMLSLLGVSVLGAIAAAVLVVVAGAGVLRRRAAPVTVLMWGAAMVVHGTLLITAAAEAGHVRYTIAPYALEVLLLAWLAVLAVRQMRAAAA